jgi:hypothetical protein
MSLECKRKVEEEFTVQKRAKIEVSQDDEDYYMDTEQGTDCFSLF